MATYILLKDLEGLSAGDEVYTLGNIYFNTDKCIGFYKKDVEEDAEYFKIKNRFYTEEDMRKCFQSARKMNHCSDTTMCRAYKDFEEYLKIITP